MRRIEILLPLLIFVSLYSGFAGNNPISDRLSNPINGNEKVYFNLFPSIKNFQYANVVTDKTGKTVITVHYNDSGKDAVKSYYPEEITIESLKKAINQYEHIVNVDTVHYLEINWNNELNEIISPTMRFTKDKFINIELNDYSDKLLSGYLLWADSVCIIYSKNKFDPTKLDNEDLGIIFYNQIKELNDPFSIEYLGSKSIYYLNLEDLQNKTPFFEMSELGDNGMPPELYKFKSDHIKEFNPDTSNQIYLRDKISENHNNWHFYFDIPPYTYMQESSNMAIQYFGMVTEIGLNNIPYTYEKLFFTDNIPSQILNTTFPSLAFEYNINDYLSVGIKYTFYSGTGESQQIKISTEGSSSVLYVSYVKKLYNPYSANFLDHIELAYQAGFLFGSVSNNADYYGINTNKYKKKLIFDNDLIGFQGNIRAAYYLTSFLSIDFSAIFNLLASQTFPEWKIGADGEFRAYKAESSIKYTGGGLCLGLGLHL